MGLLINTEGRPDKSYSGAMMAKGKEAEEIVLEWLRSSPLTKDVIDMREFRIAQRLDVDCGIETLDGKLFLAEIKSDNNLGITPNFLFEQYRINHHINPDHIFYLGWAFRSPAKYLLYYSPPKHCVYRFIFSDIRKVIGKYVDSKGTKTNIQITRTDKQKTTFNILIPREFFKTHATWREYDLSKD